MRDEKDQFFVICPLGLEKVTLWEIRFWWPLISQEQIQCEQVKGGVEVTGPKQVLLLNKVLKSASRILWRVDRFRLRSYSQLTEYLDEFQWPYAKSEGSPSFQISAHKSKIGHRERLKRATENSTLKLDETLFIRVIDDICHVSIDTSGDHLYQRGYRKGVGKAPIRENLAAGLILAELMENPLSDNNQLTWLDPMMGSGTMLTEAHRLFSVVDRPMRFEQWGLNFSLPKIQLPAPQWQFFGRDLEAEEVSTAKENFAAVGLQVNAKVEDVGSAERVDAEKLWLISNLPYGQRIKQDPLQLLSFALAKHRPQRASVLMGKNSARNLKVKDYRVDRTRNLSNGGIDVSWVSLIKMKNRI